VRRDRTLRKGETLYHSGERFHGLFALKSGTAKLVHTGHSGHESIIALFLPGELFGFDGLSSGRYLCSLVALEPSSYCELSAHDLEQMAQKLPAVQQIMLQRTAEQMDQCIERLVLGQRPAQERLAIFLLDLSRRYRQRGFDADKFHLSLSRQEIGNHLGLVLETVSRQFSKLEASDNIRVSGKFVQILNPEGLRQASGCS
jgi:CRP/FNR family transcriptional regulator